MFKYVFAVFLITLAGKGNAQSAHELTDGNAVQSDTNLTKPEKSPDSTNADSSGKNVSNLSGKSDKKYVGDDEDIRDKIDDEIDRLEDKIDEIEDYIDELGDNESIGGRIDEGLERLKIKMNELENRMEMLKKRKIEKKEKDTVDAELIIKKIKVHSRWFSETITKSRAQGYGGGVMIQPMLLAVKMKPVNKLLRSSTLTRNFDFPDIDNGYNLMIVSGAFGFGGVGNGLRIGFGGWGGDIYYEGERISGAKDSVMTLRMHTAFGGLLVDKAFIHKNMNFIIGGVFGWGNLTINRKIQPSNAFKPFWDDYDIEKDEAKAGFAGLDLHSGFTITVLPWFHLGMDLNGLFEFSVNGFGYAGGAGFMSVNPGARLRITLGNLG